MYVLSLQEMSMGDTDDSRSPSFNSWVFCFSTASSLVC